MKSGGLGRWKQTDADRPELETCSLAKGSASLGDTFTVYKVENVFPMLWTVTIAR